jgi:hypothetical protein
LIGGATERLAVSFDLVVARAARAVERGAMVRGHGRVQEDRRVAGVRSGTRDGLTERLEAVYELGLRCTPLGVPDLKTFDVKAKRFPIVRANQAHPVGCRDREPAFIAGVSESGTIFNSVSNEL